MTGKQVRQIRREGNLAYVTLTKGYEAVIDAFDVPLIDGWNWYAMVEHRHAGSIRAVYAVRRDRTGEGKRRMVRMHRVIAGTPDGLETDHRDGNGLNNRRGNLRAATKAQNMQNQGIRTNNSSGHKGVSWEAARGKWRARIRLGGKRKSLGLFTTPEEAAAAYATASAAMHGEFGRTT